MIHPHYWSLWSVYERLRYGGARALSKNDIEAYGLLDVKGKTVLDVGAYNGDSAKFFLKNGAKKVVCIEKDQRLAEKIKLDSVEVINEPFSLFHLSLPHDCMKMDIEGYEALLLDYEGELKPSVIEVHNWYLFEKFGAMGFKLIGKQEPMLGACLMKNFD